MIQIQSQIQTKKTCVIILNRAKMITAIHATGWRALPSPVLVEREVMHAVHFFLFYILFSLFK